jgi:hypothetical protein
MSYLRGQTNYGQFPKTQKECQKLEIAGKDAWGFFAFTRAL